MTEERDERPIGARPVAVLALETGGCGACAQSVAALHGPRYRVQLASNGITLVNSPRQADIVLLSGPLSSQADASVRRILELVPEPQVLVAIGDCAINGCVFAGGAGISASAAEALDVHMELPGCPPTPGSILNALVRAAQLLDESLDDEAEIDEDEDGDGDDVDQTDDDDDVTTDAPGTDEAEGKD